jgi:hypothetical protein
MGMGMPPHGVMKEPGAPAVDDESGERKKKYDPGPRWRAFVKSANPFDNDERRRRKNQEGPAHGGDRLRSTQPVGEPRRWLANCDPHGQEVHSEREYVCEHVQRVRLQYEAVRPNRTGKLDRKKSTNEADYDSEPPGLVGLVHGKPVVARTECQDLMTVLVPDVGRRAHRST